jgi:hypothetical protein
VVKDADVLDLGAVAEEQLRLAGKSWDGVDLPPEERLDGELEGSFAGTLEHRVLADAERPGDLPMFDVLLFAGDAGVVFRAGTVDRVGFVADGRVEMADRRARAAVQEALAAEVPREEPVAETKETKERALAKKNTAAKRTTVAKKTTAKKTTAKKTTAKKTAAKKKSTAKKKT